MKMVETILMLIVVLALLGLVFIYMKTQDKNLADRALMIQAIATVVLVAVTFWYAWEARLSRISQEQGFDRYVVELKQARKQQMKPYIHFTFYWAGETFGNKYFAVFKNVGVGPAFDIVYSYTVTDDNGKLIAYGKKCEMLSPGAETANNTPFSLDNINMKNNVKVEVSYKDSFGEIFKNTFEYSLREIANNPPPFEFSERFRKLEKEGNSITQKIQIETFLRTIGELQKDISGIKDTLKSQTSR